jgi:hypothetical protein
MNNLPVVKAEPIFIDQYTFVPTDGNNIGYLQKNTVPGYYLYVSDEERPTISINTQPTEIDVTCDYALKNYSDYNYYLYEDAWIWKPSTGWQNQYSGKLIKQLNLNRVSDYNLYTNNTIWNISFKYNQIVSGNNPDDFSVNWSNPNLYWTSSVDVKNAILNMANGQDVSPTYNSTVNSFSGINSTITLSSAPSLAANEAKWFASNDNTISVNFTRSKCANAEHGLDIGLHAEEQQVLNEIANNIIPKLSTTEEAAFVNEFTFNITPTFQAGIGGVVSGAQKIYIGNFYDYYTQEYNNNVVLKRTIGFDNAGNTLFSWYSPISPLNGMVVQPNDILFTSVFGHNSITSYSPYTSSTPPYVNYSNTPQWRIYDSQHDLVLPIDRPQ